MAFPGTSPSPGPPLAGLVQQAQVALDADYVVTDLGKFVQAHEDSFLLALGGSGRSQHALPGGDILGHRRPTAHNGAIADMNMIGDTHLPGDDDVVAGAARARDANLANQKIMATDPAVMANLDEVIDLGSRADARRLKRAAVDGRARTNLDILPNFDVP